MKKNGVDPKPVKERFWKKVDRRDPDECWPWLAMTAAIDTIESISRQLAEARAELNIWRASFPGSVEAVKRDAHTAAVQTTELKPHDYFPSVMHQGDCVVCGHVQDAPIHKQSAAMGTTK